ncbi:NUDIX domain-containing protein [Planosporangium flavigriseum]|uniref:Phosphohydrolase n=1 Tax=Planosporangium flavigriseum TaxID=373681 RepID=A0A8J3LQH0_9ACTN|nr:NUDIX domain-containing protein [Planosporangium flavigriseum]NJC67391.1 NUDIX domain-containing protein [Planosporangium flavigriseum]GIG74975.1 phosphohydrolase [Planosporangium flavigriseum]
MSYVGSYIWSIRRLVGSRLLLAPGAQVVVVDDDGRLLFQRRADTGLWEFPAGACEEGSSFASTAAVELAEETGLQVSEEDLIAFGCLSDPEVHTIQYPNGDVLHCFALCFEARTWSGVIQMDEREVIDARFMTPDAPPTPLHPPTSAVLDMYRRYSVTGVFQVG